MTFAQITSQTENNTPNFIKRHQNFYPSTQESRKGPFWALCFFLIYVNDISNCSDFFNFITYADDTTLLATLNTQTDQNTDLNNELSKVHDWFCTNKLSLNASKTTAITFHTPQRKITPPTLFINNQQILNTDQTSFLGVIIDSHLSFKQHISKIASKASRICGALNKLKYLLPQNILQTIYQALLVPHINYGILAWAKSPHIHKIIKIQKRAIRLCTNSRFNAHSDPLFRKCKCLKVEDLRKLQELKFYYKWRKGELPSYFDNFISLCRAENRLRVPIHRHHFFKLGLRYSIATTVNGFPRNLLCYFSTHSLQAVASKIKNHFFEQYNIECNIDNCYICQQMF